MQLYVWRTSFMFEPVLLCVFARSLAEAKEQLRRRGYPAANAANEEPTEVHSQPVVICDRELLDEEDGDAE